MYYAKLLRGLEEFREIYHSVIKKNSPWLGHDPFPGISYDGDLARVWSDNPKSPESHNLYSIDFMFQELLDSLEHSKRDLECFINKPLYQWVYHKNKGLASLVKHKMHEWFLEDIDT